MFPYCKKCNIKKSKQWGLRNYEHSRKASRDWYQSEGNRERKNQRDREWRKLNKEYKKEYQLQWQRENKDRVKEYREQHKAHDITEEEWKGCLEYFNYSCAYCGTHQDKAKEKQGNLLHKEHVAHNGTDNLSNCIPACKSCNSKKWTFKLDEWYNLRNPIYDKNRMNRITKWLTEDYKQYINPFND